MPSPLSLLHFASAPRLPLMLQSEAAECGLACLAMVAGYHGHTFDLPTLRRRFSTSMKGTTMKSMLAMAQRLGMSGRGLRFETAQLKELRTPAILHWDMNHFVVLAKVRGTTVVLHDPALGERRLTLDEASAHFTGVALELTPTAAFEKRNERSRLKLTSLWGRIDGMKRTLLQSVVLSAILQLFVLASPFYMQMAVDQAVLKGDGSLLLALALGFGLFTLFKLAADWLRGQVLLVLSNVLNFQMVANLFHHLVRLPLAWFEKQHVGDLVSRFGSTRPIRDLIAEGLVAAIVDGVMAVLTVAMIFIYSPLLASIVLLAFALYVVLRLLAFRLLRQREAEQIHAQAKEQSAFIETIRAIQSIKIFGRESEREAHWQNNYVDVINRNGALGKLNIGLRTANDLLYGLENIVVIYLGARLAMDNALTIGMLFAFMSYKQQFLDKATRLVEVGIQYRMLDLHLERIAEIALSEKERGLDPSVQNESLLERPLAGRVTLRSVRFRYAEAEPEVLSGVDLDIRAGEFVAVTGASGGGKTTLLKIILGLFRPTAGQVLIDDIPLEQLGPAVFRARVGVVMQDDSLLSGSIAENISFFDPSLDIDWLRQCARTAGIDDDIMGMPMNYNTLIGDMGMALSGGQRQRILLARALYRRPCILLMDEATSHLDVAKEQEVNRAITQLGITRIVIAHRPETIAAADRILVLQDGKIISGAGSASSSAANSPARTTDEEVRLSLAALVADDAPNSVGRPDAVIAAFSDGKKLA